MPKFIQRIWIALGNSKDQKIKESTWFLMIFIPTRSKKSKCYCFPLITSLSRFLLDYNCYIWNRSFALNQFSSLFSHDFLFIESNNPTKLTGRIPPQTIKSLDDSDMIIRFTSDHKFTKNGFKIRISYVDDGKHQQK